MRWLSLGLLVILGLCGQARGQGRSSEPDPQADRWNQAVQSLARVLSDNDATTLVWPLADDVSIRSFDSKATDAVKLLARTRGGRALFVRGYNSVPQTLAGDIAQVIRDADVPEEIKRRMDPRDDERLERANRIAVAWVNQTLECKPSDRIGVIVLFCARPADDKSSGGPEMVFVLVKAAAGDSVRIQSLAFGDPQANAKQP